MPVALMVQFRPQAKAQVSSSLGRAVHANVLRLISEADADLAQFLHDDKGPKPFTVSNILEVRHFRSAMWVGPEQLYSARVTLLSPQLEELAAAWMPANLQPWNLDGVLWDVEHVICDPDVHPWSGKMSYGELSTQTSATAPPTRWTLEFQSPVTFRQRSINQPLPLPALVFGSLLDKWNAFAPLTLPEEVRRFAEECMGISRFNLRSVAEPTKNNALQIGSVGHCTYNAMNRDRYWCACLDTLTHFAFWSGVGAGATRGFGRTRLAPPSSNED